MATRHLAGSVLRKSGQGRGRSGFLPEICGVSGRIRAGSARQQHCPPTLLPIPRDMTEIPNEFYRAEVVASYSNGVTLCKCEIPQSGVSAPVPHNIIGIFDQDGELDAVALTLPDWVTPSEIYRAYPAIMFPIQKSEESSGGN